MLLSLTVLLRRSSSCEPSCSDEVLRFLVFAAAAVPVLHGESSDSEWGNVPKLLIGRLSAPDGKPHVVMSVPFEYPELIARIDELLTSA